MIHCICSCKASVHQSEKQESTGGDYETIYLLMLITVRHLSQIEIKVIYMHTCTLNPDIVLERCVSFSVNSYCSMHR